MFEQPCGLLAELKQKHEDGSTGILLTTSLPLLAKDGGRMILTFGPPINEPYTRYGDVPTPFAGIETQPDRFVDLGFGIPSDARGDGLSQGDA